MSADRWIEPPDLIAPTGERSQRLGGRASWASSGGLDEVEPIASLLDACRTAVNGTVTPLGVSESGECGLGAPGTGTTEESMSDMRFGSAALRAVTPVAWVAFDAPRAAAAAHARRVEVSQVGGRGASKAKPGAPRVQPEGAPLGTRIGVISDNHGYLDPAVLEIFAGVTHIIHAGDIVDPEILVRLGTVAPVTAVAGNMDSGEPTSVLPREVVGEVAGVRFLVGHKRKRLLRDLAAGNVEGLAEGDVPDLVIYGHDHIPAAAWVDGTLYLDPGSASAPHEEDDGPTVAIVEVKPAGLAVSFVPLERRDSEEGKARPKG
jgi:putative phosphoesterase